MTWIQEAIRGGITVWCYDCGMKWYNVGASRLWKELAKCPYCGGATDGIRPKQG